MGAGLLPDYTAAGGLLPETDTNGNGLPDGVAGSSGTVALNTFDSWFGPSGGVGSGGVVHPLTDLVTLMKTYTQNISETLEENFIEAEQVRPHLRPTHPPNQPTSTGCLHASS